MKRMKSFAAVVIALTALAMPTSARDFEHRDRYFDRNHRFNDRYDRGWERNYSENQRFWNGQRGDAYREGYRAGLRANNGYYYQPRPSTIIVTPSHPYDYPAFSGSNRVIYGDGNLTPVPRGTVYYFGSR